MYKQFQKCAPAYFEYRDVAFLPFLPLFKHNHNTVLHTRMYRRDPLNVYYTRATCTAILLENNMVAVDYSVPSRAVITGVLGRFFFLACTPIAVRRLIF
jgi:hypothetical protein